MLVPVVCLACRHCVRHSRVERRRSALRVPELRKTLQARADHDPPPQEVRGRVQPGVSRLRKTVLPPWQLPRPYAAHPPHIWEARPASSSRDQERLPLSKGVQTVYFSRSSVCPRLQRMPRMGFKESWDAQTSCGLIEWSNRSSTHQTHVVSRSANAVSHVSLWSKIGHYAHRQAIDADSSVESPRNN